MKDHEQYPRYQEKLVKYHEQYPRYLEKLVKDHEQTIRELEDENGGVYELLTEQRALDTSISSVQLSTVPVASEVKEEQRPGSKYVLCSRCKEKLGAKEETKPSKLGTVA